jgi:hypothetical protein
VTDVRVEFDTPALARLLGSQDGPVGRDLQRRAIAVEAQAKVNLSHPGSGRVYRRKGRVHQASAPGEMPAPDTGLLRASVHSTVSGQDEDLHALIGTDQAIGLYQELGTRHIVPRPWLRPALDAAKE